MRNVPQQIEKFFEIQHFDFDNSNALLQSPAKTELNSSSDTSSQHNYKIQMEDLVAAPQGSASDEEDAKDAESPLLTAENLRKRDSLMMLDEEAKKLVQQEV